MSVQTNHVTDTLTPTTGALSVANPIKLNGSTSGAITISAPAVAGTNTLTLPANTGTVITTASSGQVIPKAALPTGSVLQVVQSSYNTQATTTSSTFSDTGLSASITPTSSTSKILVLYSLGYLLQDTNLGGVQLLRGATVLQTSVRSTGSTTHASYLSNEYLDSPATTSSTTYKIQFAKNTGNAFVTCWNSEQPSTMTLLEIAA
jgi:hypothetical protein